MLAPEGREDRSSIQAIGARYAHGKLTLEEAAREGCRVCPSAGGGCHFLGTAATAQVVAEALGMTLTHSALAPSGEPLWLDGARRSARADLARHGLPAETRLWAAREEVSGGPWGGCVFDTEAIVRVLEAGKRVLRTTPPEG